MKTARAARPTLANPTRKGRPPSLLYSTVKSQDGILSSCHSVNNELKPPSVRHPPNYDDQEKSWKAFKGIIRAMETAYVVQYWGWELLPRPKANILHRGLDEIAKAAGLGEQTEEGFANFLDDLCPCGLRRHKEAVRKLGSRFEKTRRRRS
jgi:hypothetical protein